MVDSFPNVEWHFSTSTASGFVGTSLNFYDIEHEPIITLQTQFSFKTCNILIDLTFFQIIPETGHDSADEEQFSDNEIIGVRLLDLVEELPDSLHGFRIFISIDF